MPNAQLAHCIRPATAEVYQVTMCSGPLSHLHVQLLPRLPGEQIGGGVFSSPRMVLTAPQPLAAAVKRALA